MKNLKKTQVVTIEGGDGSGKSTVIKSVENFFNEKDIDVMFTREPGGVKISEQIRNIILDTENTEMDAKTEALLYAAARRQHLVQKVFPAIEEGKIVVFDRYVDSSVVYQGFVRGIGMKEVFELNQFAIEGFLPDLTLYLDVDPEVGLSRIMTNDNREVNRLDLEGIEFHHKVRKGYLELIEKTPERFAVIDANKSIEEVIEQVVEVLNQRF